MKLSYPHLADSLTEVPCTKMPATIIPVIVPVLYIYFSAFVDIRRDSLNLVRFINIIEILSYFWVDQSRISRIFCVYVQNLDMFVKYKCKR